jgi:hypothetical protein
MVKIGEIISAMTEYFALDARRVNHFIKVYGFAKSIGECEGLSDKEQYILEAAALTHDIGIKNSELKFGNAGGFHQQVEGPPEAEKLLGALGVETEIIERVCWLIAHHHTYADIQGLDYQILIEADFIVNAFEDEMHIKAVRGFRDQYFKTKTGIKILNALYEK